MARSIRDAWPWFVLAGCCLFLVDVFVRRVAVNFNWLGAALKRVRGVGDGKESTVTARLDALKKNKQALDDSLQRRRASVRFEPTTVESDAEPVDLGDAPSPQRPIADQKDQAAKDDGPSYTERLLEAKRRAKK